MATCEIVADDLFRAAYLILLDAEKDRDLELRDRLAAIAHGVRSEGFWAEQAAESASLALRFYVAAQHRRR